MGSAARGSPTAGTCARTAPTRRASRSASRPPAEGTAVTIVHSDWQRLGQRERNERGWDGLVPHYVGGLYTRSGTPPPIFGPPGR